MKIAFHDNSLSLFGTTVALYNWAYWGKRILDYTPIIMYNQNHPANNNSVIEKFKKEFDNQVFSYNNLSEIDDILSREKCQYFFMEKGGKPDGVLSSNSINLINAIAICSESDIHGDVFAVGSEWLSSLTNYKIPYVPYIVHLPDINQDLRSELNIPNDAFVFGRTGGRETFDIAFVKEAILSVINQRSDLWFVFQHTEKFIEHERVIFLPSSSDSVYKAQFINTCDAMIHARTVGESFGMACGEFSIRNKPVITWSGSAERSHIDILGKIGIYYKNKNDIVDIFSSISKKDTKDKDWNAYKEYTPEKVMNKFNSVYLTGK